MDHVAKFSGKSVRTSIVATMALLSGFYGQAAQAQDGVQAGISAAVRGDVQLARLDSVGRQVNSGEAIFLNDAISSGSGSGMQVLLLDETVFTIGPESELTIDKFVYDPATGQGSLAANMTKGVMRFVTGNISSGQPENMTIKLPVGTIGIRGTIGVVSVLTPQQAGQQFPQQSGQLGGGGDAPVVFAALIGPGPLSQTGSNTGSFNFSTPDGSVDLNRPGGAVLATPGQPPVFFIAPSGAIQQTTSSLNSRSRSAQTDESTDSEGEAAAVGGDDSQSGAGEGEQADNGADGDADGDGEGNNQANSGNSPQNQSGGGGESQALSSSGAGNDVAFNQLGQVMTNTQNANQANQTSGDVSVASGSVTTFGDIAAAFGSGTASGSGNLTGNITGSFNTFIDFSARTVDVQTGTMSQNGSTLGTVVLNSGSGVFVQDSQSGFGINSSNNTGSCSSCTGTVTFTSTNSMQLQVEHNGGTGTGSATYQ